MDNTNNHGGLLDNGLFSPEFNKDPWPVYERLRKRERIFCSLPESTCVSVKYDDIRTALGSDSLSASPPAHYSESILGETFRDKDGSRHQRLRHAFLPLFRRQMVERMAPVNIDPVVTRIIEDIAAIGGSDFVSQVAEPLAIGVACRTIGIPESDGRHLYLLAHALMEGGDGSRDSELKAASALNEVRDYLLGLLRRRPAPDTLLAHLEGAAHDTEMEEDELVRNLILVYAAATKPMAAGLSNTFLCLARHPKEFTAAGRSPSTLREAINESLRHETPFDLIPRYAKQDLSLGGRIIPVGTQLLLALASANRDESIYIEPAEWNPGRAEQSNLAFGAGRHVCMGRYLALELLERSVGTILNRLGELHLSGSVSPSIIGPFVRMPRRLDITI